MNRKLTAVLLSALVTAAGTTAILNAGGEQELARFNEQLKACFPAYQTLEKKTPHTFRIMGKDAKELGTLYLETARDDERVMGYAGTVEVAVAVGTDGKIAGVLVGKNKETRSFMRRIVKAGFFRSWNGKTLKEAADFEVDAVTRATYSSTAISEGVRKLAEAHTKNAPSPEEKTDHSGELQMLLRREAMLKNIVSGSKRLLTQLQTRKNEELELRLIAATKGKDAAMQFAKKNNLMFFQHPGRSKSKVDTLAEQYRANPSDTLLQQLKAAILENYERMLQTVPPHNQEQEKALAAVQERIATIKKAETGK